MTSIWRFLPMAVSDYEPEPHEGKISSKRDGLSIPCKRTPKVIRAVRDWAPSVYLVGFKLQSNVARDELIRQAHDACLINRADLTVANDLNDLKAGRHTLYLVRPGRPTSPPTRHRPGRPPGRARLGMGEEMRLMRGSRRGRSRRARPRSVPRRLPRIPSLRGEWR